MHGNADDIAVKHHRRADERLHVEHRLPAVDFDALGHQNQSIANVDGAAEADVFDRLRSWDWNSAARESRLIAGAADAGVSQM